MCEKVILEFGPIETIDIHEVDAKIQKALDEGLNFDIEFEGSDYNLQSYLETKVKVFGEMAKEMEEEMEKTRRYIEDAHRYLEKAQKGFSDDVILNSIIYSAMSSC